MPKSLELPALPIAANPEKPVPKAGTSNRPVNSITAALLVLPRITLSVARHGAHSGFFFNENIRLEPAAPRLVARARSPFFIASAAATAAAVPARVFRGAKIRSA